ncbi:hypothetical protein GGTG_05175 [Gaeumannomyces tritici R3-111a-1]|uniref:Protein-lysine N-methyltransferase EFM5 n=1 Tax=Gaeumannomyces tritici (strain R3-111a-1) TaxID=644352 RepID=J3NV62_GAET3|nr:hypothetical protein GGTG_05175 [Gaeumannomyces tritici R3-111a-1]EJT75238.1 hypothetical protein GGTG_05175 [Gaeumannomyces tritici R3-111a-1]
MGLSEDFDDEPIALSSHALDALKSFYADRDALEAKFEDLLGEAERQEGSSGGRSKKTLSIADFGEDWQESQFWYSDGTARAVAESLLDGADGGSVVAAVSAPSVFVALKNMLAERGDGEPRPRLVLLEHDRRFAVFPEFVFYDCNQPLKLPDRLKGACDRIACDPPFLNEDCQTKEATTVQWLARPQPPDSPSPAARVVLCTGERMGELVTSRLYGSVGGLRTTTFQPEHANKLSNEFCCYTNFECAAWDWRGDDDDDNAGTTA